jgi:DNA-binding transcriptional regulator YhcF (GntR family)
MHRIWISRHSSIPIREQLAAQLLFAIISRRLAPCERLPSVRDLARRLKVHPNTVSAAYRDLAARGWVTRKAGSGVFVRDLETRAEIETIDAFAESYIEDGLHRGFSLAALSAAFEQARQKLAAPRNPSSLLVVHPDTNLARILAAELREALGCPISHASIDGADPMLTGHALVLTTTSAIAALSKTYSGPHQLIPLKPVEEVIRGFARPTSPQLIAIVSRSETVRKWAALLLPALGLPDSDLIQRNPEEPNWKDGLAACDLVACDLLSAQELPKQIRPLVLRLVSDSFLRDAGKLVTPEKL